jgi:hypothetical protein
MDLEATPGWCRRCGGVADVERVEPVAEIERELAELRDPGSERYRAFRRVRAKLIAGLERRRLWRAGRRSPARCLSCGSADVVAFPMNEAVPHPAGDGTVEARCIGFCRVAPHGWLFTAEGERIASTPAAAETNPGRR